MKASTGSARAFPDLPGVYLFKDKSGKVIYVGKAKSLKDRVSSYFGKTTRSPKTELLIKAYSSVDFITAPTELEALLLERKLIEKYKPHFNISLMDDKQYPYIKLTLNEDWPRLLMVRKKEPDGARYFGPYESKSVRDTLRLIKKLFPIRWCKESPLKRRGQPCLQYHLKHCWAPCAGKIPREEYLNFCRAIISVLNGDIEGTLKQLNVEMELASEKMEYEKAARLRDRIRNIRRILEKKPGWMPGRREVTGETGLFDIRDLLSLKRVPRRIEAFDVSNLAASNPVAAMVVFVDGEPLKRDYRKFKIRSVEAPNDVAAIEEVVRRRYTKTLKDKLDRPDLILIDGGLGSVRAAKKALNTAEISIPLIGLAKKNEEIFFPQKSTPLIIPKDRAALKLLMRIRDEAHRFAINYQRALRAL